MGTRSRGKQLEKCVTEGHEQFVCPFQWNLPPKEDTSLQKNMFPDAGLACRRCIIHEVLTVWQKANEYFLGCFIQGQRRHCNLKVNDQQ
ncbi:hypothetical protein EK904_010168 [Melospiza melodia maxima]|nr:hypothetical protein EK904_010168 [Melospiza melodia maxima]